MLVRHWMTERLEVARPDDDMTAAWTRMQERGVRQLPVVSGFASQRALATGSVRLVLQRVVYEGTFDGAKL